MLRLKKSYQKFLETVPGYRECEDYYLVSDNPEDGLRLVRALNIKKAAELVADEVRMGEASVSFKTGE